MYVDAQLLFSDEQVICDAASELSTNIVDLGVARNIAKGKQLYVVIIVDTSFAGPTSIDFRLMTHITSTVSSGSVMVATGPITPDVLTANRAPIVLPVGDALNTAKQYIGMYYVLVGSVASAGKVTAFLAVDAP